MNSTSIKPRVTVVLPALNAEDCIGDALDSALRQRRPPDEIIVVDDGSTDRTKAITNGYGSKVRYIYQANAGPSAARNTGIRAANSEWVAFLDSDDLWLPEKLSTDLGILTRNPNLVWASSNYFLHFFGEEKPFPRVDPLVVERYLGIHEFFESFLEGTTRGLGWDPTVLTVRKDVLEKVGLFREDLDYAEDLELSLRISLTNPRVGFSPVPLAIHRVDRPNSLCNRKTIAEKMESLRMIYDEYRTKLRESKPLGYLDATIRPIVQDNVRSLFLESQSRELKVLLKQFEDVLTPAYIATIRFLLTLPKSIRNRIYRRAEWRILRLAS
jgi:glycosyltransferase involved in cell wall biosynthesis